MRYIQKTGTPSEAVGRKETKAFIDACWCNQTHQYDNLSYDRSRIAALGDVLVNEQKDDNGNSYCCYCMRRLFLKNTPDGHNRNVTYEHIIPHRIKSQEWDADKDKYLQFPNLRESHITLCFDGELTEEQRKSRITGMPYPHFISYHNLVASCDGITFEEQTLQSSRCCNNCRQERFVMPVYLSPGLSDGITYTSKGELDYDDTVYDSRWFDRRHLNLTNAWITLVRRIWYKVAKSAYSDMDVEKARTDKELRQNIIDDIDSNNEIASWNESDPAWNLFAEYNWFYGYYTSNL